jgi:nitrogen-specific signal transduction histidine kinase/CheY-like chemotaxis protein
VGRDVSERKRLEEQLIQAQRMEAVGRLSGGIAHDFNNLLTAMIGYCDLALEDIGASDPLKGTIEEIRKAGTRAADLTKQLLAFSRKQILRPRIIDLNAVIAALTGMLERLIGEDIRLVTRLDQSLGRINADPGQMEQVIMNLCLNSRDAMPNGGEVILSTTNLDVGADFTMDGAVLPEGAYASLTVSDTGVGMDEETQAHVFEPFYTTKHPGKGTGLGLSTVYGIVKQSGGHIRFTSAPGRGTSFEVIFPRTVERRQDAQAVDVEKRLTGAETVLLVEDEPIIRRMMQETLEKSGYTVVTAASAEEALYVTGTHGGRIHLVILDLVLPGMSGMGLGERLKEIMAGTRIMYISGYAGEAVAHQGKLPADAAFLQKPFPPTALLSKVREVLDNPR